MKKQIVYEWNKKQHTGRYKNKSAHNAKCNRMDLFLKGIYHIDSETKILKIHKANNKCYILSPQ